MSPAISASLSAIDWPWQTRQRKRLHQPLGLGFLGRIGELAVGVGSGRQAGIGQCGQPLGTASAQGAATRIIALPRSRRGSSGTSDALMSPTCWWAIRPRASITKLSGTPDDPSANWIFDSGSLPIRSNGLPLRARNCLQRRFGIADRDPVDLHARLFQPRQDRRFGDARRAPAGEDVEQARLALAEVGAGEARLARHDRGKREGRQRLADQGRADDAVGGLEQAAGKHCGEAG